MDGIALTLAFTGPVAAMGFIFGVIAMAQLNQFQKEVRQLRSQLKDN